MNPPFLLLRSLKTRLTVFTLVIFVISLWLLALFATRMLREDMQHLLGEQQQSMVSLVADQINEELVDRLAALELIASQTLAPLMGNPTALQARLEQRPMHQLLFNGGLFVTGPDGTAIADVPLSAGRIGTNYMDRESVAIPLREGKTVIGRPAMGKKLGAPIFSMVAPIRDAQGRVIGALVATVNLGKPNFLDKITRNRYGKTGGYLLEDPKSRQIITGTDKSHIMQALPAPGVNWLIDRHVQGFDETGITVNPKGVEVLASARRIPAAGWFIVVSLPTAEAFAPIRDMQKRMLWATIVLTLLASALTWWMLRRELAPMLTTVRILARLSESNQFPHALPVTRHDEIGDLLGGFNRLLDTLAQREQALSDSQQKLATSTQFLERSGELAKVGGWEVNLSTMKLGWTMQTFRIAEMAPPTEPSLEDAITLYAPEARPTIAAAVRAAIDSGTPYDLELPMITAKGRRLWVRTQGFAETRDGRTLRLFGTFQDITERKLIEADLAEREANFRTFYNSIQEFVFVLDVQGSILFSNDYVHARLHYCVEELRGQSVLMVHPAARREEAMGIVTEMLAGTATHCPVPLQAKDGQLISVETRVVRGHWNGKPALFGLSRDMTERVAAEEALRKLLSRLQLLAKHLPGFLYQYQLMPDGSSVFPYASSGIEAIYGLSPEEAARDTTRLFTGLHPGDLARVVATIQHSADTLTPWHDSYRVNHPDGRLLWVEGYSTPIRQSDGSTVWHGYIHDITERKQAEQALRASQAFAQEVLNSVPQHIAVIDTLGTILAVNEAWRRFSRENSAVPGELSAATDVGANYLSICSSAGDDARAARDGIEAVLNGEMPGFALEYPCHSPSEQRWFAMSVSPLRLGGQGAVVVHSNITARILAEQEIAQKTQRLANIIWGTGVGTWEWNVQTGQTRFNERWADLIGYTLAELAPVSIATWMKYAHPDDLTASGVALEKHFSGEIDCYECESRMRHKDGHWIWVLDRGRLVSHTPAGLPEWIAGTHTDITARKQAQAALQLSESRLRTIVDNEPECIKIIDSQGRLKQMNHAGLAMIEADSEGQVLDRPVIDLIAPEHRSAFADMHRRVLAGESVQMEFKVLGLKGGYRWLETHAVPMQENDETFHLAVTRDITERHNAEVERAALIEEIRQLAYFDALTGLPNRRMLGDRLSQTMASSKRSALYGALMFLDLDNFKPLNDMHGHSVGDLLLVEVAKRLCACIREMDTVARLGGDEFVVVLSELHADKTQSAAQAGAVAEKIRASLAEPYHLTVAQPDGQEMSVEHHCSASIGVVLFVNHEASQTDLMKWADAAMYQAKDAGRNTIRFYEPNEPLAHINSA